MKNRPKPKREELSLKQKVYIGIAIFGLIVALIFKVGIPQYSLMQGRRMAEEINQVIKEDHFVLMDAERKGVQFFSSFQSTVHKDLVISTDIAPDRFESNSIRFLYERAVTQKSGTIRRFDMATSDVLYDSLKPVLGDALLRVMGEFGEEAPEQLELDQPFVLGELRSWTPTVDLKGDPSDETFLNYLTPILAELDSKNYGYTGVNIRITPDRKTQTTYSIQGIPDMAGAEARIRRALTDLADGERPPELTVQTGTYYDFPYNHDFTLPAGK